MGQHGSTWFNIPNTPRIKEFWSFTAPPSPSNTTVNDCIEMQPWLPPETSEAFLSSLTAMTVWWKVGKPKGNQGNIIMGYDGNIIEYYEGIWFWNILDQKPWCTARTKIMAAEFMFMPTLTRQNQSSWLIPVYHKDRIIARPEPSCFIKILIVVFCATWDIFVQFSLTLYSQSWLNDAHSTISNGPEKDFCKTIASGLIWNWSDFLLHFLPSFGSFWSFLPMTAPFPDGSLSAAKSLSLGWLWKWNSFLGILGRPWIKAYDSKNHSWVCYPWLLPLYIGKNYGWVSKGSSMWNKES